MEKHGNDRNYGNLRDGIPAKFRENTSTSFRIIVRKLNGTDGRGNISRPRAYDAGGR